MEMVGGKMVRHPEVLVRCSLLVAGDTPSPSHSLASMPAVPKILPVYSSGSRDSSCTDGSGLPVSNPL
jgi:hypothetical protein